MRIAESRAVIAAAAWIERPWVAHPGPIRVWVTVSDAGGGAVTVASRDENASPRAKPERISSSVPSDAVDRIVAVLRGTVPSGELVAIRRRSTEFIERTIAATDAEAFEAAIAEARASMDF